VDYGFDFRIKGEILIVGGKNLYCMSNLQEQISAQLAAGKSKDAIYRDLLTNGVALGEIEAAFAVINKQVKSDDYHGKVVSILSAIGAVFVGIGVIALVAFNWEHMADATKIFLMMLGILVFHVLGWLVDNKYGYVKTGRMLALVGTIIFGSSIFLVAQIFHISGNWPDGFLLWMLGALAYAFANRSYAHFVLGGVLGYIAATGMDMLLIDTYSAPRNFILSSLILLAVSSAAGFLVAWYMRKQSKNNLNYY